MLLADLADVPVLILAISGGPDSIALLLLAARWRASRKRGPTLVAVTVDHGLRVESKREANAVKKLARSLGVPHRTLRWTGRKPKTGLQQAARNARYKLLAEAARKADGRHMLTAHTLDDQAETVLIRLARGSGVSGLAAMARSTEIEGVTLVRPLLDIPKSRLIATVKAAGVPFADDPSNRDPRFTRARLRGLLPVLEREGLVPRRLALLARRVRRANAALESAVEEAVAALAPQPWPERGLVNFAAGAFFRLPAEVGLRLLGRAVARAGDEGPVELAKLEALHASLTGAANGVRFRRTLAGAVITRTGDRLVVERAPARASKRP